MANRFRVTALLPPLAVGEPGEVVKRTLTRVVNGGEPTTDEILVDASEFSFEALQNDQIHLELRNVDDAGNVGPASVSDFTVFDTVPPNAPGEIGIQIEEILEDPAPQP